MSNKATKTTPMMTHVPMDKKKNKKRTTAITKETTSGLVKEQSSSLDFEKKAVSTSASIETVKNTETYSDIVQTSEGRGTFIGATPNRTIVSLENGTEKKFVLPPDVMEKEKGGQFYKHLQAVCTKFGVQFIALQEKQLSKLSSKTLKEFAQELIGVEEHGYPMGVLTAAERLRSICSKKQKNKEDQEETLMERSLVFRQGNEALQKDHRMQEKSHKKNLISSLQQYVDSKILRSRMYISDPKQGPLMVMWHWVDETMGVLNYSVAPVTKMIPKYKPEIATAVRLTRPLNSKKMKKAFEKEKKRVMLMQLLVKASNERKKSNFDAIRAEYTALQHLRITSVMDILKNAIIKDMKRPIKICDQEFTTGDYMTHKIRLRMREIESRKLLNKSFVFKHSINYLNQTKKKLTKNEKKVKKSSDPSVWAFYNPLFLTEFASLVLEKSLVRPSSHEKKKTDEPVTSVTSNETSSLSSSSSSSLSSSLTAPWPTASVQPHENESGKWKRKWNNEKVESTKESIKDPELQNQQRAFSVPEKDPVNSKTEKCEAFSETVLNGGF